MHVTSTIVTSASVRRVPTAAAHQRHQRRRRRSRKYGVEFTAKAVKGKLDPVIGRDGEIRCAIVILSCRAKNNPVLIGDPGVGKGHCTAHVFGRCARDISGVSFGGIGYGGVDRRC